MMKHTDASLPWLDAALTGFSLVGTWWGAQKVHCELVALDCGGCDLYRRVLYKGLTSRQGFMRCLFCWLCLDCGTGGVRWQLSNGCAWRPFDAGRDSYG